MQQPDHRDTDAEENDQRNHHRKRDGASDVKHSGYGREGSYYGIEEYVEVKYVRMSGLDR